MIRNEAPKSIEGEYKVLVKGKKVTVTDMKTRETATARCHPDDKFDLGVGVNEAVKKMNRITVGDKVKILSPLKSYTLYAEWVYQYVAGEDKCRFVYGEMPSKGKEYQVLTIAKHLSFEDTLAYIKVAEGFYRSEDYGKCYLVSLNSLEKVND